MKNRHGFTMIEVLIVATILALLVTSGIFFIYPNLARGRDGKRMSDLTKLKIAFEDYYNDNECYPPITTLESYCGGTPNGALDPYMQSVPCDPRDRSPYAYLPVSDAGDNTCGPTAGYRVLANLERDGSEASRALNCVGAYGCGVGINGVYYDYGVAEGTAVSLDPEDTTVPDPLPGEDPPSTGEDWFCVAWGSGNCVDNAVVFAGDFHGSDAQNLCNISCQ